MDYPSNTYKYTKQTTAIGFLHYGCMIWQDGLPHFLVMTTYIHEFYSLKSLEET